MRAFPLGIDIPQADGATQLPRLFAKYDPAGGAVDDGVPNALQRQDHGTGHVQTEVEVKGVDEGIHPVDAAGCPGNENTDGEHKRGSQIG
jgi:hypothetical protein